MQEKAHNTAVQRGVKAAGIWKKFRNLLRKWDNQCASKAKRFHLPVWMGHTPVVLFIVGSVTTLLLGGLVFAAIAIFVWMAIVGISSIGESTKVHATNHNDFDFNKNINGTAQAEAEKFAEDSILNGEYHGSPYRSPSDE